METTSPPRPIDAPETMTRDAFTRFDVHQKSVLRTNQEKTPTLWVLADPVLTVEKRSLDGTYTAHVMFAANLGTAQNLLLAQIEYTQDHILPATYSDGQTGWVLPFLRACRTRFNNGVDGILTEGVLLGYKIESADMGLEKARDRIVRDYAVLFPE